MKKALFNITVYGMLGWSIISATYMALPTDVQALIPQMNWFSALISGGSTLLVGSGGLAVQSFLTKAKTKSDEKYNSLANEFLKMADGYLKLEAKVSSLEKVTLESNKITQRNNVLHETELKTKLDNPMLTQTARELIESILNEK